MQLGDVHLAQQIRQAPHVVLVTMGEYGSVDTVGVFAQVGKVRQHQVDTGHVGLGEHQPHVHDHDASVDLDTAAIPPDFTETTKEHHSHRIASQR